MRWSIQGPKIETSFSIGSFLLSNGLENVVSIARTVNTGLSFVLSKSQLGNATSGTQESISQCKLLAISKRVCGDGGESGCRGCRGMLLCALSDFAQRKTACSKMLLTSIILRFKKIMLSLFKFS